MFDHPLLPSVMLLPQYSHVIIISPNFGESGAAQLGHFKDVAVEGAITWVEPEAPDWLGPICPCWPVLVPHFEQKAASSGN